MKSRRWIAVASAALLCSGLAFAGTPASAVTTWEGTKNVSDTTSTKEDVRLAASADGQRIAAVWAQLDNNTNRYVVQYRVSIDGGENWSFFFDLSDKTSNAGDPELIMSADGTKVTVIWSWFDSVQTKWVIQTRSSSNGGASWGSTKSLSTMNARFPRLTASDDGNILTAVWRGLSGGAAETRTASSPDAGGSWTAAATLSDTSQAALDETVTSSASGQVVTAAWAWEGGQGYQVRARTSGNGGATWGPTKTLSDGTQSGRNVDLAMSASGATIAAVWYWDSGATNVIQVGVSTDSGANWGSVRTLSDDSRNAYGPTIALSGDGARLTAVWKWDFNGPFSIQTSNSSNAGATWGAVQDLSDTAKNSDSGAVVMSADGQRVSAIWKQLEGGVYTATVRSSGDGGITWEQATSLSDAAGIVAAPQLAASASGSTVFAAWQQDPKTMQLRVGQFDPDPIPVPVPNPNPNPNPNPAPPAQSAAPDKPAKVKVKRTKKSGKGRYKLIIKAPTSGAEASGYQWRLKLKGKAGLTKSDKRWTKWKSLVPKASGAAKATKKIGKIKKLRKAPGQTRVIVHARATNQVGPGPKVKTRFRIRR